MEEKVGKTTLSVCWVSRSVGLNPLPSLVIALSYCVKDHYVCSSSLHDGSRSLLWAWCWVHAVFVVAKLLLIHVTPSGCWYVPPCLSAMKTEPRTECLHSSSQIRSRRSKTRPAIAAVLQWRLDQASRSLAPLSVSDVSSPTTILFFLPPYSRIDPDLPCHHLTTSASVCRSPFRPPPVMAMTSKMDSSWKVDVGKSWWTTVTDTTISMPTGIRRNGRWFVLLVGWMGCMYEWISMIRHPLHCTTQKPFPEFNFLKSVPSVGVQRKEVPTLHHPNPPFAPIFPFSTVWLVRTTSHKN